MAARSWNPLQPRIRATNDGGPAPIRTFKEAAGQSYKAGALVYLDATNGLVTACADGATLIAGVAQEDAAGTVNTAASVQIVRPGDELYVLCYDQSDGAQVAASTFKAGFTYDLEVDTDGVGYADIDTEHATTEEFIFIEPVRDVNGDSTNWGVFQVEAVACNFGSSG